jgi:hypothetical protein
MYVIYIPRHVIATLYIIRIINRHMYVHRRLSARPLPADVELFYKQRAKYGNQIHRNSAALTGVIVKCFFIPTAFE